MANKTQRKPAQRSATKPARVAVAPGKKKLSARKGTKAGKPARKAAPKKAALKKAAPKKAAPKKAAPRKAAPKKAAPAKKAASKLKAVPPKKGAVKKAVPAKKAAPAPVKAARKPAPPPKPVAAKAPAKTPPPAKKAAPEKAPAPAKAAKPEKPKKLRESLKEPPAARAAPPAVSAAGVEPDLLEPDVLLPEDEEGWAAAAAIVPPVLPTGPRKRGRKRRDPLDDLLSPDKPKRGRPGRPRKRSPLMEVIPPKRARLRKRLRARRSGEGDDFDLPVAPRPPAPRDTMTVEEIRADVLARYLKGETPSCPVGCGGLAQVVRVSTSENGAGEVWLECLSCAQRERFEVPAPTTAERDAVYATLEAGNEPLCPRHSGRWLQLRRRGRDLVCPECGILIAGR